jgi:hypothetical protein
MMSAGKSTIGFAVLIEGKSVIYSWGKFSSHFYYMKRESQRWKGGGLANCSCEAKVSFRNSV